AIDRVEREHAVGQVPDVAANSELVGAIRGVVLPVAAELPNRRHARLTDIEPIFERRRMSAVFGVAAAAGDSLPTDGREGVTGAHRIVLEDTVVRQHVLPEDRQRAIGRRTEADITVAVVPLAGSAGIRPRALQVLGNAGVVSSRSRSTGQFE